MIPSSNISREDIIFMEEIFGPNLDSLNSIHGDHIKKDTIWYCQARLQNKRHNHDDHITSHSDIPGEMLSSAQYTSRWCL